jgi:hypothetical protein
MWAMSTPDGSNEREREFDEYRRAVIQCLGEGLGIDKDEDFDRFLEHVERCFDWGVQVPACARTWVARGARGSRRA